MSDDMLEIIPQVGQIWYIKQAYNNDVCKFRLIAVDIALQRVTARRTVWLTDQPRYENYSFDELKKLGVKK